MSMKSDFGAAGSQHLQQARVVPPRPGPLVQRGQALGIDADDDDVAVALACVRTDCARLRDGVLDAREAPVRVQKVRAGEDGQHGGRPSQLR